MIIRKNNFVFQLRKVTHSLSRINEEFTRIPNKMKPHLLQVFSALGNDQLLILSLRLHSEQTFLPFCQDVML